MRLLGRLVTRRRWFVIALALALLAVAGVLGATVESHLSGGGLDDPSSESSRAAALLQKDFQTGEPDYILLVTAAHGSVDGAAVAVAGRALTRDLALQPGVAEASSYWTLGSPAVLRSVDGTRALVLARLGGDEQTVLRTAATLTPRYQRSGAVISVGVTGDAEVARQVQLLAKRDLGWAVTVSVPLIVLVLVLVVGGVAAASLPLAIGLFAVLGTLLALRLLSMVTEVSILTLDLTTAMGFALALGDSLLVVYRYREEIAVGREREVAVVRTLQSAGRTVVYGAVLLAVSLGALLLFPLGFLRSFAQAGIAAAAIAALGSIVVLPALLYTLGALVEPPRRRRLRTGGGRLSGIWFRQARSAMRRPVIVVLVATGILVVIGLPVLRLNLGLSDARVLPTGNAARDVSDTVRANFAASPGSVLTIVVPDTGDASGRDTGIDSLAADLSRFPGVVSVDALTGTYTGGSRVRPPTALSQRRYGTPTATWMAVTPSVDPLSPEAETLVGNIRATSAPFTVLVGGPSARLVDTKAALFDRMPTAVQVVLAWTYVLLVLMVGGLFVPIKALVAGVLSLSASFGMLVWVFQDGHLSGVLGFTSTDSIGVAVPTLLFFTAFGLAMAHEVFALARIKEEYDLRGKSDDAVAAGIERTGRVVTGSALLLGIACAAVAISGLATVKLVGLGLALAVLVGAFGIRLTLLPALMRLGGRANWWAPRLVGDIHRKVGIGEFEPLPVLDLPGLGRKGGVSLNGNSPKAPTMVGGPRLVPPDEQE